MKDLGEQYLRSYYKADWSHDAVTKHDERLKKKTAKGMAPMDQIEDDDDEDLPPLKEVVAPIIQHKKKVF
jgi:hypothetical protein